MKTKQNWTVYCLRIHLQNCKKQRSLFWGERAWSWVGTLRASVGLECSVSSGGWWACWSHSGLNCIQSLNKLFEYVSFSVGIEKPKPKCFLYPNTQQSTQNTLTKCWGIPPHQQTSTSAADTSWVLTPSIWRQHQITGWGGDRAETPLRGTSALPPYPTEGDKGKSWVLSGELPGTQLGLRSK